MFLLYELAKNSVFHVITIIINTTLKSSAPRHLITTLLLKINPGWWCGIKFSFFHSRKKPEGKSNRILYPALYNTLLLWAVWAGVCDVWCSLYKFLHPLAISVLYISNVIIHIYLHHISRPKQVCCITCSDHHELESFFLYAYTPLPRSPTFFFFHPFFLLFCRTKIFWSPLLYYTCMCAEQRKA